MREKMEEGIEICPKCKGQGSKRYRLWDNETIVENLIRLKKGCSIEKLAWSMWLIKIRCPLCDGDRIYDWVRCATKGHISKEFAAHEGCMELYWAKAAEHWPVNSKTHAWFYVKDLPLYQYPVKLIECGQKRYRKIKLNKDVLSFDLSQLRALRKKIKDCYKELMKTPGSQVTEEQIISGLKSFGLSEYVPDKIVHPGPDDFPT
jgi:hypothetical protein